jgi:carboxynorspermidine decarboxylase
MDEKQISDYLSVKTPCQIINIKNLFDNLKTLQIVAQNSGCQLLFSMKVLALTSLLTDIALYVNGFSASSLNESILATQFKKENIHVHSPVYSHADFEKIVHLCDHIVFNSVNQLNLFYQRARELGKQIGLRINPEVSTIERDAINPCSKYSRFGVKVDLLNDEIMKHVNGFHFHTMCEQYVDDLVYTLNGVKQKFGKYFHQINWLNIGGGQLITESGYQLEKLVEYIQKLIANYNFEVFIEPGEAFFINTGCLVSTVNDIVNNDINIAIIDASAICHMPNVVNSPYRPEVLGAFKPNSKKYTYRLTGPTCFTGDIWGDYSFECPLEIGSKIIFLDSAHYSIVKSNMFSGTQLPDIAVYDGNISVIKRNNYEDFLTRIDTK